MNDDHAEAIALKMRLHKAVDGEMDAMVQLAVRVASLLEGGTMRENQLRNVLSTALNTGSLELVANFIRYQIGRSSDWQRKEFGEQVIAAISQQGPVGQAAARAVKQLTGDRETLRGQAHMLLTRRFLGELNRAFLYADRTRSWKELKPILEPAGSAGAEGGH